MIATWMKVAVLHKLSFVRSFAFTMQVLTEVSELTKA